MRQRAISLLSGGLDSAVATALARREYDIGLAITFDYGQRAARREVEAARALCRSFGIEHKVIGLPWLADITTTALVDKRAPIPKATPDSLNEGAKERAEAVWVPNRNGVFVAIAAATAEARGCDAIVAGFNAEEAETFPDNSAGFIEATNAALKFSTRTGVTVISPTAGMNKADIARKFVLLKIDPNVFWCCYDGRDKLCGACESCARTIRAFKTAGFWGKIEHRFK